MNSSPSAPGAPRLIGRLGLEAIYLLFTLVMVGGPSVPALFGVDVEVLQPILAFNTFAGSLPVEVRVVALASRIDKPHRPPTLLTGWLRTGRAIIWGGLNFTLGAYLAGLLSMDLTRYDGAGSLGYFWRTLALFSGPILWGAAISVFVPTASAVAMSCRQSRERAAVRLLPARKKSPAPARLQRSLLCQHRSGSVKLGRSNSGLLRPRVLCLAA